MSPGNALICAREARAGRPCHTNHMGGSPMPLDPANRGFQVENVSEMFRHAIRHAIFRHAICGLICGLMMLAQPASCGLHFTFHFFHL